MTEADVWFWLRILGLVISLTGLTILATKYWTRWRHRQFPLGLKRRNNILIAVLTLVWVVEGTIENLLQANDGGPRIILGVCVVSLIVLSALLPEDEAS